MKKLVLLLLLVCTFPFAGQAKDINVRDLGAVSDGTTLNTTILQKAIDDCSASGGGTVLLTGGGQFLSGTLYMKSFVTLKIDANTTLLASTDLKDYPKDTHKIMYKREAHMNLCFIYGENCKNISFEGQGTIDGNGAVFKKHRPMLLRLKDCDKIRMRDLTLRDPAAWTTAWLYCNDIAVNGITISSRVNNNGDGLDFDGCQNVRVSDCTFDTSDDSICLQSSRKDKPCQFVTVTNCTFTSKWAAIRIGLLSMGDIAYVTISNCVMHDILDSGLKIQQCEEGRMHHMSFSNIIMRNVPRPIFMTFCPQRACVDHAGTIPELDKMDHFSFDQIMVDNSMIDQHACIILSGMPEHKIQEVSLNNIQMTVGGKGTKEHAKKKDVPEFTLDVIKKHWPEYYCLKGPLPAYGLFARHIEGLHLNNVKITPVHKDARKERILWDIK